MLSADGHADPTHVARGRGLRLAAVALAMVACCAAAGWGAYALALQRYVAARAEEAGQRTTFYAQNLRGTLARYESLPRLAALEHMLHVALTAPHHRDAVLRRAANAYLKEVQVAADLTAVYLMDAAGQTLAASNWDQPSSFIGRNYAFRPYFVDAMREGDQSVGAVAVKINLDSFEATLARSGDTVLLVDRHGVIFLSSVPEWKYRTLGLLGWQVAVLIDPRDEQRTALVAGASAAFAMALAFAVFVALRLRARRHEEQRSARAALREVQRDLEARIAQRTVELTSANAALASKVEALDATQRILRETRDAAVQAGKLAVLGQMAVGITHELNQPLTALTTLSDNANQLAERGRVDEVRGNLAHISQLAHRMGRIVSHIKGFARKGDALRAAVPVEEAIRQALMLVDTRRRQAGVPVAVGPVPPGVAVWANAVRLEQVLVNLIRNAIDATAEAPQPEAASVRVTVDADDALVRITVRDAGPGIAPGVLSHLFEPFFTTKADGQGLGLGLAISLAIVEDFGGRLDGRNADDGAGGAAFVIELERVLEPHA
ncbi:sensor histidine kinase [Ralstonia syzygii]|uniref:sensor histidine kinase n=1 Tax=Ralstonia syzygii TaxID=28097 RepID=UPI0018D15F1C|nr:ATP-binding protein [Ralstonia syzygii]